MSGVLAQLGPRAAHSHPGSLTHSQVSGVVRRQQGQGTLTDHVLLPTSLCWITRCLPTALGPRPVLDSSWGWLLRRGPFPSIPTGKLDCHPARTGQAWTLHHAPGRSRCCLGGGVNGGLVGGPKEGLSPMSPASRAQSLGAVSLTAEPQLSLVPRTPGGRMQKTNPRSSGQQARRTAAWPPRVSQACSRAPRCGAAGALERRSRPLPTGHTRTHH